jgi:hypothetical protein
LLQKKSLEWNALPPLLLVQIHPLPEHSITLLPVLSLIVMLPVQPALEKVPLNAKPVKQSLSPPLFLMKRLLTFKLI